MKKLKMKNKLGIKRHQNGNTYKQTSLSQVQLNALPCPHTHTQCIYGLLNKGYEIKQADTVIVTQGKMALSMHQRLTPATCSNWIVSRLIIVP